MGVLFGAVAVMKPFVSVGLKLAVVGLVLAALGLPVLDTWRALVLAFSTLLVAVGAIRTEPRRWALAVGAVLLVVAARSVLPRADIAEAHNAFLVLHDGEALQQGLPPEVFANWKAQFDALYPPIEPPYTEAVQWRRNGVPSSLFTQSADAIWRPAKYTRQVDAIGFRTLGEFRGGFANDNQYNFWTGELLREEMPFYAMYELTPASVGSALAWKGQVFWPRADGTFEEIVHREPAARAIAADDAGRRVYALFVPKRDGPLDFRFIPSSKLRFAGWAESLLAALGVLAVLVLAIRPCWGLFARAASTYAAGYAVMVAFLAVSAGKYLGRTYPPQGGGDDGMVHDGWGRIMAFLAGRGEIVEALKGLEPVYWFTPGLRYFRMVEKLVFGDTNHLYALLLPCVLIAVFCAIRHFTSARVAVALTAVFCLLPVGNSYLNYISNAKLGYAEALASGLFLTALVLLLRNQPAWGGTDRHLPAVVVAGAALAATMFVRPNYVFAVVWLGAAYAWVAAKQRDAGRFFALAAGLSLALWLPFHNWYYGGEFYLISKSGATVSVPIGVRDYVAALGDVLRGRLDTPVTALVFKQVGGWLFSPGLIMREALRPLAWAVQVVKLLALLLTGWVAVRALAGRFAKNADVAVIAVASICAHVPMLFIFTTHYRYAMLGWDLSLVVLIAWFAGVRGRETA